jgi:amino acid permease
VAHIITAVIGSGVLSLAWSTAQLGWIGGPVALLCCAIVTYISSFLLSDCYRNPDSVTGKRNYSYMDAVRVNLGNNTLLNSSLCRKYIDVCFFMNSTLTVIS